MSDPEDPVAAFLAAPKTTLKRMRWRTKRSHKDFVEATTVIVVESDRALAGQLTLTAHLTRKPYKFGFNVVFGRAGRVFALDVEPGHVHKLTIDGPKSEGTHWHPWPEPDRVEPDPRVLPWTVWLDQFLARANIRLAHPISTPPVVGGEQLKLGDW